MVAPASRRALLCGIATLPALGAGAVASSAPSDLAAACAWAIRHYRWACATANEEDWPDDRFEPEMRRYDAVMDRAVNEPSQTRGDLTAKALLLQHEMETKGFGEGTKAGEALAFVVLREIIAVGGLA